MLMAITKTHNSSVGQKELNRVTVLDEDPFSDPVELQDVIDAAKRLNKKGDQNWS